jgi:hypothetical protein
MIFAMKMAATKLLSAFVVAFLCLNAGAFLCLAHCNTATLAAADHCPRMKAEMPPCHRQTTENKDETNVAGSSITCCMLPVGVFAAPLEKRSGTITAVAVETAAVVTEFSPVLVAPLRQLPKFYYRPPPNDLRFERVRNQVFRI